MRTDAIEPEKPSTLEHAIDDGLGKVLVVQYAAPRLKRSVCREDHRAMTLVPFVDHVKEHVGGVGAVGEITDLVDDEHGRMCAQLYERCRECRVAVAEARRAAVVATKGVSLVNPTDQR